MALWVDKIYGLVFVKWFRHYVSLRFWKYVIFFVWPQLWEGLIIYIEMNFHNHCVVIEQYIDEIGLAGSDMYKINYWCVYDLKWKLGNNSRRCWWWWSLTWPYNTHYTCVGDYSCGQIVRSSSIINEINYQDWIFVRAGTSLHCWEEVTIKIKKTWHT